MHNNRLLVSVYILQAVHHHGNLRVITSSGLFHSVGPHETYVRQN